MTEQEQQQEQEELTDEQAIIKIAQAMKDNAPAQDEKNNVHTFLTNVIQTIDIDKVSKVGNLRDDKDINELGIPVWNVRSSLELARISEKLMGNNFFKEYFEGASSEVLGTSLSREGFLIRQSTTNTKNVADVTKRRKANKGWFSKGTSEESGGDPFIKN